jgi:hypothetical protein
MHNNETETELFAEIAICSRLLAASRSLGDPASVEAATRLNAAMERNTNILYERDLQAWLRVATAVDKAWFAGFAPAGIGE